jgi:hypothetical protein
MFFFKKLGCGTHSDKIWSERRVLVIPMSGTKVPERCSGLCPSEKELMEWHSDAFRHKNTPGDDYLLGCCAM